MRVLPLAAAALALAATLTAQAPARPTRLGFALGTTWDQTQTGFAGRAEFYPWGSTRALSWRLEAGTRLTPTTFVRGTSIAFGANHYEGIQKSTELSLGVTGLLTPFPHGRFTPYMLGGAYASQEWLKLGRAYLAATGEVVRPFQSSTSSLGKWYGLVGAGLRARIGSHDLRLEARYSHRFTTVTLGGVAPF